MICICCRITPKFGQCHPHSVEIKYGAMKGTHRLCEACHIEVKQAYAKLVEGRHTFEVLKNAVVNIQERIARRQQVRLLTAAPKSCRLEEWRAV